MTPDFHSSGVSPMAMNPLTDPRSPAAAADPVRIGRVLGAALAAEETALAPLTYEEIEAYVDGAGDEAERLLIEERLARDPAAAAVAADLRGLAAELTAPPARVLEFRPAARRPARLGWLAAAAAAVLAVILVGRPETAPDPTVEAVAPPARPAPTQPLFIDGFEEGTSAGWSEISSGG